MYLKTNIVIYWLVGWPISAVYIPLCHIDMYIYIQQDMILLYIVNQYLSSQLIFVIVNQISVVDTETSVTIWRLKVAVVDMHLLPWL